MRYFSTICLAAGLLGCLAAAPARADVAIPEAGSPAPVGEILSALQALNDITDAAAAITGSSALISETRSGGPSDLPSTSKGVDSSRGSVSTGATSVASMGSALLSSRSGTDAAAPSAFLAGQGSHQVGSQPAPSVSLPSLASSAAAPQITVTPQVTLPPETLPPAVPVPASVLLLGGGLLGVFPLRRSARLSAGL